MADDILDPFLDADELNKIVREALDAWRDLALLGARNIFQRGGRMAGQEAMHDKVGEMMALQAQQDQFWAMLGDPNTLEGDRTRAQQGLLRFEQLTKELFG